MQQVFHTWIWGSSAIPPCRSSPVLSGWMVNVGGQPFLGLSRDAQLGLSQGSGWAIQEQSRSCCEATLYFSCVLRVIVLLEGKPSAQRTLEKVFVQDIPVLGRIHLSLDCNQSSCPCSWKTPPQHDAATTMLHCWDCIGQVMSSAWFSPHIPLTIKAKKFYLGLIRPENLICHHLGVLQVFFSKLHVGFHVFCTEERLPSGHSAIKPRLVEGCSDGWLSTTFSHLPNASLELSHSDLWVLLYLSHQGSSPPIAQFGRMASSRKGSGRPKHLPFKDYGGHCALRNLKCGRNFFVTLARSVPCHNSASELFRQFLWPHDSHLLWRALWAVRSYTDRCVAFLIKSNQYNQTQLDSNEGVEPSQGWSEEMDSTWVKYMSVTAKGLNT